MNMAGAKITPQEEDSSSTDGNIVPISRWKTHGMNMAPLSANFWDHRYSWRDRLLHILHHKYLHYCFIMLLVLDVIFVIVGIALEIQFLESEIDDLEHHLEECIEGETIKEPLHIGDESLHKAEKVFAYMSLAILIIFLIENILLMVALGRRYFLSFFYVMDLCVVVGSIVLEIVFQNNPEGGLLIFARTWRFARIAHGLYETTHSADERDLKKQYAKNKIPLRKIYRQLYNAKTEAGDKKSDQGEAMAKVLVDLDPKYHVLISEILLQIGLLVDTQHRAQHRHPDRAESLSGMDSVINEGKGAGTDSYLHFSDTPSSAEMNKVGSSVGLSMNIDEREAIPEEIPGEDSNNNLTHV